MRIRGFLLALALLGVVLTAVSYAGAYWWAFDVLSNFRTQLSLAGVTLFLLGALTRSGWTAMIALAAALASAGPLWPYEMDKPVAAPAAGATIRVITANLHGNAGATAEFRLMVTAEMPDILVLTELPTAASALLRPLALILPHLSYEGGGSPFETVILSRFALRDVVIDRSVHPNLPVTRAVICPERDSCLTVIALHASRPIWTAANAALRDAALRLAAQWAREAEGRVILAGDLNTTPWSPAFADLLARGRLRDTALGRGVQATWPGLAGPLGLAIDHVLVGERLAVRDRRVGNDFGSDHRPLIADVVLR